MNLFINAVRRAEEDAREREALGFKCVQANWVNHLPAQLMRAELLTFIKDAARSALCVEQPKLFRNYTPTR